MRDVSEAMHRAAEAMFAATESIRRQFYAQQGDSSLPRPFTYHAHESRARDQAEPLWPGGGALVGEGQGRIGDGASEIGLPRPHNLSSHDSEARDQLSLGVGLPHTKHKAYVPSSLYSDPPTLPQVGAPPKLGDDLHKRPDLPRGRTTLPSFGAQVLPAGEAHPPNCAHMFNPTSTTDWPITTGSTSSIAPITQGPAVRTGPGPQWPGGAYRSSGPGHVDLLEAAERVRVQQHHSSPSVQQQVSNAISHEEHRQRQHIFHGAAADTDFSSRHSRSDGTPTSGR